MIADVLVVAGFYITFGVLLAGLLVLSVAEFIMDEWILGWVFISLFGACCIIAAFVGEDLGLAGWT